MTETEEFEKHKEPEHKAGWINDISSGGNLHFECSVKNCEIYSDVYKCPKCSRRMDTYEKKNGICGDCGLSNMVKEFGGVRLK